jgi:hypothetical protein
MLTRLLAAAFALALLCCAPAFAWVHGIGSSGGGGGIPTITAGTLQPGSTTGATNSVFSVWTPPPTLPGQQGSAGTGFNDDAIGVWRMPYQYSPQSGTFKICVIGYHQSETNPTNPLAKVAFFLDGGTEVDVTSPNFTEVWTAETSYEYCVQVSDSALADGPHEARAILYPTRGYPRLLSSIRAATTTTTALNAQAHGMPSMKVLTIAANPNSDTNFTVGSTWCLYGAPTNSQFQLGAFTPPYPLNQAATVPTCATTATNPTAASESITVAYTNAGLQETQPKADGSLFFATNRNGTLLPSNPNLYVSQPSGGSSGNNCTASGSPCDTISHALGKLNQAVSTCSFTASANFTSCGSWPVNQAVVMTGGTTPGNFQLNRPYWVKTSSSGTITLCLEPGCATAQAATGSGTVNIVADYSFWNLNLLCPSACSSPSTYKGVDTTAGLSQTLPAVNTIYGWFNVVPSRTTHANTIINAWDSNGFNDTAIAGKVHYQVDLQGDGIDAHCNFCGAAEGAQDTWIDGVTYGVASGADPIFNTPAANARVTGYGWYIVTKAGFA